VPEDSDAQRIAPQTLLDGRYRLADLVAVGSTGEVWKATDELLDHRVAVKILKRRYALDADIRTRFRGEARHAMMLSHPGISRVHDYGEQGDDLAYLVMEFLSGESLSSLLSRGPIDVRRTMEIVGQVARAIQVAHDAGVIHRDIKPANLIVSPDGVAKVTDFGTARVLDAETMTQPGMIVGTALYLSPEQAQGLELTISTDIYSLGVVAYECLVGDPPFSATMPAEVAFAHIHDRPAPLPASVPADAAALVLRCLEKDPEQRPASMAELAQMTDRVRGRMHGRHGTGRTVRTYGDGSGIHRRTTGSHRPVPGPRRPAPRGPARRGLPIPGQRGVLAGAAALSVMLLSGFVFSSSAAVLPMTPFSDQHRPHSSSSTGTNAVTATPTPTLPAEPPGEGATPTPTPTASDARRHGHGKSKHPSTVTRPSTQPPSTTGRDRSHRPHSPTPTPTSPTPTAPPSSGGASTSPPPYDNRFPTVGPSGIGDTGGDSGSSTDGSASSN
jgi:serine/threonine-protein kinase